MAPVQKRYQRNVSTLSVTEQERLGACRVAVIGLGGLGGGVCELLARIGIGDLVLVDGDCFDETNLNRQLLSTETLVGMSKARAARSRIEAVNSQVRVTAIEDFLTPENSRSILEECDLVVDCLDSITARFLLSGAAKEMGIPMVSGAIAGTFGQVTVLFPEDPGLERIYGDTSGSGRGIEQELGNLSYTALFVASIQASETVKVLLNRGNCLRNRLLIVDLMALSFDIIELETGGDKDVC